MFEDGIFEGNKLPAVIRLLLNMAIPIVSRSLAVSTTSRERK